MGGFILVRNNSLQKQIKSGEISDIGVKDFLPFGTGNGSGLGQIINDLLPGENDNREDQENQKKSNLVAQNIAGSTVVERADEIAGPTGKDKDGKDIFETTPAIRYVLKENGYVYDYLPKYKKSYLISDTSVPHVSFATFSPDGNQILFQYLAQDLVTEKSVLGTLGTGSVVILPDNIISFSFSNDGQFAYVRATTNGANFIIRNKSEIESIVYSSPIKEWNIQFLGNEILATTKASEVSPGFSYIINTTTNKANKLFGEEKGLTTKASLLGGYILKAITLDSGPSLSLYNVKTGALSNLGKLGLTEKCSFSKDETILICAVPRNFENKLYPDSWYLGEISTNDGIVQYSTANLNEKILNNLTDETGEEVDVWQTFINNAGNIITFTNKNDMSLWSYEE